MEMSNLFNFLLKVAIINVCILTFVKNINKFMVNSLLLQNNKNYDTAVLHNLPISFNGGISFQQIFNGINAPKFRKIFSLSPTAFLQPHAALSTFTRIKNNGLSFGEYGGRSRINEGDNIPSCEWKIRKELPDGTFEWDTLKTDNIFGKNKLVVLFALPGAFTPTCSSTHLPKYEELFDEIKKYGVDDVFCLSVNDAFVMNAWKKHQKITKVQLIPDGSCIFTDMIGMGVKKDNLGFGKRSWRYSMVINDGKVEKIFEEEGRMNNAENDPFVVSDAHTILNYLINRKNNL